MDKPIIEYENEIDHWGDSDSQLNTDLPELPGDIFDDLDEIEQKPCI